MSKKADREITFSDEGGYLLASISGPWKLDVIEAFILEVQQKTKELGYKHTLINVQELNLPGKVDFGRFRAGEIIAREWGPYIKAAAVGRLEDISKYVEDTAVNRGANFAVFSDMEEAKKWLLG